MSDERNDRILDNRWQPIADVDVSERRRNWLKLAVIIAGIVAFGILDALVILR
ncbi:MAG TPA: hypothetical protein VG055_21940 [Planctomycetaceae bacterium]|nr:hypothetical protein [Planctomycetaceae bacterium]